MQAYGAGFARVYSRLWGDYIKRTGPRILESYAGTAAGQAKAPVLDLCCGAGHLALQFLEAVEIFLVQFDRQGRQRVGGRRVGPGDVSGRGHRRQNQE